MFVKSVSFLPTSIKSINPMQKYPHINESFGCTRKMLFLLYYVFYYVFIHNKFINFFRNMFNTKAVEINNFLSVTK